MTNISEKQKYIYNTWLAVSRRSQNLPYKLRKDFEGIDNTTGIILSKLETFFHRYPHIDIDTYIAAPFKLLPGNFFELKFFITHPALDAFIKYMKSIIILEPDVQEQVEFTAKSLKFIGHFCFQHNITVNDYLTTHKECVSYPDWFKHLKNYQINIYSLMEFDNLLSRLMDLDSDLRSLMLHDYIDNYIQYKSKYDSSITTKNLVKQGLKKISNLCLDKSKI